MEYVTINSNYMLDKIIDLIRVTGPWDFKSGRYYNAILFKDRLKDCNKALKIVIDMGLERDMKKRSFTNY